MGIDLPEEGGIHQGPHPARQRIQRAEGRQLKALLHQGFNGDVDQIGRPVHPARCFSDGERCLMPRGFAIRGDAQVLPDELMMAIQGPWGVIPEGRLVRTESHRGANMRDQHLRDLVEGREGAQPLETLEQQEKIEAEAVAPRSRGGELDFLEGRRVDVAQFTRKVGCA
jgi:hypothetical protein